MTASTALGLARTRLPDVPVVIVSGAIGEETAIDVLKAGATDYVLKQRLSRLGPVVKRALKEAELLAEQRRIQEALRQSEAQLRLLIEGVKDYAIFMLDPQGRVTSWNAGTERHQAIAHAEIIGRHVSAFYLPQDVAAGKPQQALDVAARQGGFEEEGRRLRKDGSVFWADVTITPVRDEQGQMRGFAKVVCDVTDRKRMEQSLVLAKAAAEAANQAKSRFLANISHELRTPMNAILGMVDLTLQKTTDPAARDYLQTAKESAGILLALLNDLLDSAKIESGKLELESAPFSLHRLLDNTAQVLGIRAAEKGISFSVRIPDDAPDAFVGDHVRLEQILFNLAGNAIKFTERGEVEISVKMVEGLGIGDWGLAGAPRPPPSDSPPLNPQSAIPDPCRHPRVCRPRHRHRHPAFRAGAHFPALRPGRSLDHPPLRRHGAGTDDLLQPDRPDGRTHLGRERAGTRQHLLFHRPLAFGQGTAGQSRTRHRRGAGVAAADPVGGRQSRQPESRGLPVAGGTATPSKSPPTAGRRCSLRSTTVTMSSSWTCKCRA